MTGPSYTHSMQTGLHNGHVFLNLQIKIVYRIQKNSRIEKKTHVFHLFSRLILISNYENKKPL